MTFRRLYWVTEQIAASGVSQVTGIYTSIHDLTEKGFRWAEGCPHRDGFRLTLSKLDSMDMPLATWQSPAFTEMEADLAPFLQSNEFSAAEIQDLVHALETFTANAGLRS